MALLSLAVPVAGPLRTGLLILGLAGASLLFGDAMITPAISVLSAVEGLGISSPTVTPYVVPIAAVVLGLPQYRAGAAALLVSCSDR
jgi:KUP system potassium uptake protein